MCPFLLWKTPVMEDSGCVKAPVVEGSCYGELRQYTFEKRSRCSCPAYISPIPKDFSFSGYFLNLCLPYTQSHFSAWVYSLIFSSLYPRFFSVLGILTAFASLYPKISLSLGTLNAFFFSIPKGYLFHGYISDFCIRYTQTSIFI